jgi:MFS family permease
LVVSYISTSELGETGRVVVANPVPGGSAGEPYRDGISGTDFSVAFLRNVPVEVLESEAPVLVHRYALVPDSEGAGQYRGGFGVAYDVEIQHPSAVVVMRGKDRFRFGSWGAFGGGSGNVGQRGDAVGDIGKRTVYRPELGEVIKLWSGGGGGYGDLLVRDPDLVVHDLVARLVSSQRAHDIYGVVLQDGTVNTAATADLRSALTTLLIPQPALGAWAWRLPFLFGALLSLYGMWMRRRLPETPYFVAIEQRKEKARRPIFEALHHYPASGLYVFAVQIGTVMFYLWTVFLPTYANLVGKLPISQGLLGGTISLGVFTVAVPVMAAISDRIGRKPLLICSAVGFLVLARPLFSMLGDGRFSTFLLADIVGCLLLAMVDGIMPALFCELFPTRVRTSGIGIPYQLCSAIFSGTAPLIAAWFIHRGEPMAVTWYVMAIGLTTGIVFCFMPETRGRSLD